MDSLIGLTKALENNLHIKICAKPFVKDFMVLVENASKRTFHYAEGKVLTSALTECSKTYYENNFCPKPEYKLTENAELQLDFLSKLIKKGISVQINKTAQGRKKVILQNKLNLHLLKLGEPISTISGESLLDVLNGAEKESFAILTQNVISNL